MILRSFAVYDVKADLYMTPFFMPSIGQAIRAFTDLVNDPQSHVHRYPDEFRLEAIGSFNDNTGILVSESPSVLGFARDFLNKAPQLAALPALEGDANG